MRYVSVAVLASRAPAVAPALPHDMGKRGGAQAAGSQKRRASASDLGPSAKGAQAASAAPADEGAGAQAASGCTSRRQLGRRSSEETIERAIQQKFSHIPSEVLETKRFDGLLIRDRIRADRTNLAKGQRLGAKYWDTLLAQVGEHVEGLGTLHPGSKDHRATPNSYRQVLFFCFVISTHPGHFDLLILSFINLI
jgi:hypothetical protein